MSEKKENGAWRQFGIVLRHELKNFLTNKGYLIFTIILIVGLAVLMFFPRIIGRSIGSGSPLTDIVEEGESNEAEAAEKEGVLLLSPAEEESGEALQLAFASAFPEYEVRLTKESDEQIRRAIADGEAECAFVLADATSYTYYVDNFSMYDTRADVADELLRGAYVTEALAAEGVDPETATEILSTDITHEVETAGVNQMSNFVYSYIMIIALYMVIMIYGQIVAGGVASEKTSRAMEVLITSARAKSLMFGKIIGAGLAGLIQLAVIFGAAVLFFRLNASYWSGNPVLASMFNIPPLLLVYLLLFFVLGYFLYACLYGAFGSTVSKTEDVQMATMPMTFCCIVIYMIVIFSLSSGTVDSLLMKVCSFIPLTSPMAMFARICMSTVPFWQIALSIGILAVTVYLVGVIAARIYRMGVLLYGNAMRPGAVLKALRTAEKAR